MQQPTVLVSGAGIAGATLAFLLGRRGFRVTLVERARGLRSSGTPVDVEGAAFDVAAGMGLVPALRVAATSVRRLVLLGRDGRRRATTSLPVNGPRHIEIPRGDLSRILCEAAQTHARALFDESIVALEADTSGVNVTFERNAPARFDLVIGCDGLRSNVRALAFGDAAGRLENLGMYVATFPLGRPAENRDEILMYNVPDRAITIHPGTGEAVAALMFRRRPLARLDPRDEARQRAILEETYRDAGFRAPELLDHLRGVADFYFDAVMRVRLASWSHGRVALVGDAASCVSFLGGGSSNAITGAARLAAALTEAPRDHVRAFAAYEREHRKAIRARQRGIGLMSHLLVPGTALGIAARNLSFKAWAVLQAAHEGIRATPDTEHERG